MKGGSATNPLWAGNDWMASNSPSLFPSVLYYYYFFFPPSTYAFLSRFLLLGPRICLIRQFLLTRDLLADAIMLADRQVSHNAIRSQP